MTSTLTSGTLAVAAGGAIGASLRHLVGLWSLRQFGPGLPVGTLGVNVVGSFLMGVLAAWLLARGAGQDAGTGAALFLGTGVLGGFTTFSAFSLDAVRLLEARGVGAFAAYVGASVGLSLIAVVLGLALAKALL